MNKSDNPTIKYYDMNANEYSDSTIAVDMSELYSAFLKHLPPESNILDVGCGSGRDSKYFLSLGFNVTPIEPSKQLAVLAEEFTGLCIQNTLVQDINYSDEFTGIWACASLLHIAFSEMHHALTVLYKALKTNGIIFMSLKKGEFEGLRGDRYFCDYTLDKFEKTGYRDIGFVLLSYSESYDKRVGRNEELWINLILQKP